MKAYIVDPKITLGEDLNANEFFKCCREELEKHVETIVIGSEMVIKSIIQITQEDIVIFFNRNDNEYPVYFTSFLEDIVCSKTQMLPIAVSESHRMPPKCISNPQSYDVKEALERRKLTYSQLKTVSISFARDVISLLQPTLTRRNMVLFLSHRRFDGEKIAGAFYDELCLRAQDRFRDLSDILVGENAQEVIERNLRKSDAVILLDTPKCGESEWVELEIRMALSMNLPIVWVKIGSDTERVDIKIKPAEIPHFVCPDVDLNVRQVKKELVDSVIHKAFEISRENAKNIFGHLRRIRKLEEEGKIQLEMISQKQYMYQVSIPRQRIFRYAQKPITHVISLYGRIPQDYDKQRFNSFLAENGYSIHPKFGYVYDAAIMLAPMASQKSQDLIEDPHFIDSCDEYVNSLELYLRGNQRIKQKKKGVIISGAFPDCQPEYQQNLWNALHAFVQAVLVRDGTVIFGAHPTFQQLIFDIAKLKRTNDYIQAIHMYISKYFATQAVIDEYKNHATVTATDAYDDNRSKSLTTMRKAMIQNDEASCMVVIGGKTARPDITPGVEEEIELAKAHNLPVFLIGSVGGRTAEITSELYSNRWKDKPNHMSVDFNQELMVSLDYSMLANKLLDNLGF